MATEVPPGKMLVSNESIAVGIFIIAVLSYLLWSHWTCQEKLVAYYDIPTPREKATDLNQVAVANKPQPEPSAPNAAMLQWECTMSDNPYTRDGHAATNGKFPEQSADDALLELAMSKIPVVQSSLPNSCAVMANVVQSHGGQQHVTI